MQTLVQTNTRPLHINRRFCICAAAKTNLQLPHGYLNGSNSTNILCFQLGTALDAECIPKPTFKSVADQGRLVGNLQASRPDRLAQQQAFKRGLLRIWNERSGHCRLSPIKLSSAFLPHLNMNRWLFFCPAQNSVQPQSLKTFAVAKLT
jgi:hypothetical protein